MSMLSHNKKWEVIQLWAKIVPSFHSKWRIHGQGFVGGRSEGCLSLVVEKCISIKMHKSRFKQEIIGQQKYARFHAKMQMGIIVWQNVPAFKHNEEA